MSACVHLSYHIINALEGSDQTFSNPSPPPDLEYRSQPHQMLSCAQVRQSCWQTQYILYAPPFVHAWGSTRPQRI